ncbi:tetratricopeptide repeat protein [Acrocarpospora pleiomorpha]|uniref:Tetratricopeptide repeat protein n=1 Tax=Acrocarpospora pleiomorpha TaxID=90975 RepID=A0A5M3XVM1_9ACTN|nr:helix-turn-helix domain-containing protein [Acrocarpospora pleiomorpha]GES25234.1 tetratricopeptide repeat protein [Acrocarpospora pleiomorpha]
MADPSAIRTRADLHAALQRLHRADGRSYLELAEATGVAVATLNDMVNGKSFPRWRTLQAVLRAWDIRSNRLPAWREAYVRAEADHKARRGGPQTSTPTSGSTSGPDPEPGSGQIVEGDIPQRPRAFQQRPVLLEALKRRIRAEGEAVIDAVTGTPGVGKSMLAASYAWERQQAGWPVIAWINAQGEDQIITGLAALARRLNLHAEEDDARAAALKARNHLAASAQPGLLVFDNAVDVEAVRGWCPATGATRILITTRNRAFHALFAPVEVDVFPAGQAVAFLHQRTGDTGPGADAVAQELGCLPLAVAQAGALIARRRLTYSGYLTLLREFPLPGYLPSAGDGYPHGTAQAILLSIISCEENIPRAREMLELLSVLCAAGVPRAILYGTPDPDPAATAELDRLLADLADTSLISFSEDGSTVFMHRLIQRVLRERARHTSRPTGQLSHPHDDIPHDDRMVAILARAIALLRQFNAQIPVGPATWTARSAVEMLIEQTATLHELTNAELGHPPADLINLRGWCGRYLIDLADLSRAAVVLTQTVADSERVQGSDHPNTLNSRTYLAYAYRAAGDLGQALSLLEQTMTDSERVLGRDHSDTLASRNNLASVYESAGDLARAIPLFEQALAERERLLGGEHPDTLISRNNLAGAYESAGKLEQAIPLYETTLAERERLLGGDHLETLTSRNDLAGAYRVAGDLNRAIPLYEQTLSDYERILGSDHPHTLNTRNNLATAYRAAGDLGRAIPLHEQTLSERERVLGGEHPDTVLSRNNLAGAYHAVGDLGRAIPLFEQTLSDSERVLGMDHPHTLSTCNNLAHAYASAGDLGRAISLYEQTLADCERVLGSDHPTTKIVRNNLSALR